MKDNKNKLIGLITLLAVGTVIFGVLLSGTAMSPDTLAVGALAAGNGVIQVRINPVVKDKTAFWRCGMLFTREWREVVLANLGASDEARLRTEPMLEVAGTEGSIQADVSGKGSAAATPVELDRGFLLSEAELVQFGGADEIFNEVGTPLAKLAAKNHTFDAGRPEWCRKGTVWLATILSPLQVACFDVKLAAENWLPASE